MPTTIFDVSPAPATSPDANGDVTGTAQRPNFTIPPYASVNMTVGTEVLKAGWIESIPFIRFEPTMPEGSKVNALRINLTTNGVKGGNFIPLVSGGWLTPQTDIFGRNWQRDIGINAWAVLGSAHLAQWWNGSAYVNDLTVWHGGAAAFIGKSMVTLNGSGLDWSLGDGITGFNNVTGLVAQLQSYLDTQESLRGTGDTGDGIPCMFMMHKVSVFTPSFTDRQGFNGSDVSVASRRPTLEIDWTEPIASEAFVTVLGDAALNMDLALQSEATATVLGDAALNMDLALEAEALAEVTGDADLSFLDQGTIYDAVAKPDSVDVPAKSSQASVTAKASQLEVTEPADQLEVTEKTDTLEVTAKPDTIDVTGA